MPPIVDTFLAATGEPSLHYVVVLPPLDVCLERVRTRTGHGFTDLDAARHMYRDFTDGRVEPRHVLRPAPADDQHTVADAVETLTRTGVSLLTA